MGTFIDDFELTSNQHTLKSVDDHFIELIFDSKKPAMFFLVIKTNNLSSYQRKSNDSQLIYSHSPQIASFNNNPIR